jgi:hypothetical protein
LNEINICLQNISTSKKIRWQFKETHHKSEIQSQIHDYRRGNYFRTAGEGPIKSKKNQGKPTILNFIPIKEQMRKS